MNTHQSFANSELHQAIHNPDGYSAGFFTLPNGDIAPLMNNQFPEQQFLVNGLIPLGVAGLFNGKGGIGKTTLAMQLGASIATGTHFMGRAVRQGSVLMFLSEDDDLVVSRRLHRIKEPMSETLRLKMEQNLKILPRPATDLPFFDYGRSFREPTTTSHFEHFFKMAQELNDLRLVVIDSYSRLNRLDEIQHSNASFTTRWIEAIAKETGATVLMIHHPPKSGSSSARGSGALLDSPRFSATLSAPSKVTGGKANEPLRFKVEKFNDGKTPVVNLERLDNGLLGPASGSSHESEAERLRRLSQSIQKIIETNHATLKSRGMTYSQLRPMAKLGGVIDIQQDRLRELLSWAVHEKLLALEKDCYVVPTQNAPAAPPNNAGMNCTKLRASAGPNSPATPSKHNKAGYEEI
jgi:hypothetical protein